MRLRVMDKISRRCGIYVLRLTKSLQHIDDVDDDVNTMTEVPAGILIDINGLRDGVTGKWW